MPDAQGVFERTIVFPHPAAATVVAARAVAAADLDGDFVIADEHTARLVRGVEPSFVMRAGEGAKTLAVASEIFGAMLASGSSRSATVCALGGGVVCDMGAFVASLFMRGCGCRLVPTSIVAMIDAAIGGKTGVNHSALRNSVGSFYPADHVLVDTALLSSLPDREYLSGVAEAIKVCAIGGEDELSTLEGVARPLLRRDGEALGALVRTCIDVKKRFVEADPFDRGLRRQLNFGHTFAHALECASPGRYTHGEAVGWGMRRALAFGVETGYTPEACAARIIELIEAFDLPDRARIDDEAAFARALGMDKKRDGREGVPLILLPEVGKAEIRRTDCALAIQTGLAGAL